MNSNSALASQVGGAHYKAKGIQPVEFIHSNNLTFIEGNVIKYVWRWREKGGIADLEKAKHYIEMLIELEAKRDPPLVEVVEEGPDGRHALIVLLAELLARGHYAHCHTAERVELS
jgi:hypothetical protein